MVEQLARHCLLVGVADGAEELGAFLQELACTVPTSLLDPYPPEIAEDPRATVLEANLPERLAAADVAGAGPLQVAVLLSHVPEALLDLADHGHDPEVLGHAGQFRERRLAQVHRFRSGDLPSLVEGRGEGEDGAYLLVGEL